MKKVMLFFVLVCMVLVMSGNAKAYTTSDTQDQTNHGDWFVLNGTTPYPGVTPNFETTAYYRDYSEDWGWTHTVTFSVPGPITITGAKLDVLAWDVDDKSTSLPVEIDKIYAGGAGGKLLGNLEGASRAWTTTTFIFDAAALSKFVIVDGKATLDIWMDISTLEQTEKWYVTLESATLTVDYIPAPGAILLGSFGAGLVGWLRRRRTL